ncbi:multinuclear nonheme iron-dependent oxidase [Streptomyces sudanensis]|uniref:multinuclear nonheme iron-dependent oxidase n=1 Tax=Streptomyces sudanensis TaxID=436397 RepID=UPI0020CCB57D|nr:DUF692 family multinuclear iron-containing protein [Streptomyces sudanensis]
MTSPGGTEEGKTVELGTGIGWRPEIADVVERLPGVDWVEVVAENVRADRLPSSLVRLRERGVTVVPHGVSLGLGGAARPDGARLARLAATATALGAPLVSEHIAFVRAGGRSPRRPRWRPGTCCRCPVRGRRWTCCARTSASRRTRCPCRWCWRTWRRCSPGPTTN